MGGMLGMAGGIFIVLAATTFGSALLYAISGFGVAVLAAPLFLLFLDPARAIRLVIIISTVLAAGAGVALLAGAAARTVRASLLAFFALTCGVPLEADARVGCVRAGCRRARLAAQRFQRHPLCIPQIGREPRAAGLASLPT